MPEGSEPLGGRLGIRAVDRRLEGGRVEGDDARADAAGAQGRQGPNPLRVEQTR